MNHRVHRDHDRKRRKGTELNSVPGEHFARHSYASRNSGDNAVTGFLVKPGMTAGAPIDSVSFGAKKRNVR